MTDETTRLTLWVDDDNADPEELDVSAGRLRDELLHLEVEAVGPLRVGEPPRGARAADLVAIGALVAVAKPEVVASILATIRAWLRSGSPRKVKVEIDGDVIELTGVSSQDQRRLIDDWLHRHAPR